MCGINGIFAYHYAANPIDRAELIRTRDHMAARGPDGMGEWIGKDDRIGLGHRRLAIIDLSDAAAQPMVSADGKLVVIFNGEIYNYRELRGRLEAKGYVFRSQSDTEVLLHLYAEKGEAMVHDLRGMFAFAIWDTEQRTLLLARDPYGIKPLYYADDGWTLRFASQVKALLAGGAVSRDPEPAGQVGFYLFGSVPEPFTTYQEVRALPAGSTLLVDRVGAHEPQRYYSIAEAYCDAEAPVPAHARMDDAAATGVIREALLDSVRHHLVADVPVGAFLSAGIDSGALVGLMRDAGQQDIQTVTLAFEEFRGRPRTRRRSPRRWRDSTARGIPRASSPSRVRGRSAANSRGHGPAVDRWHQYLVRQQGRARAGPEGGGLRPRRRRAVRRLSLVPRHPALGADAGGAGAHPAARQTRTRRGAAARPLVRGANPKAAGMLESAAPTPAPTCCAAASSCRGSSDSCSTPHAVAEGLRRLAPLRHISSSLQPRPRSTLRQGRGARVVALHAQSAAARHRLGQHGALPRGARAAGRSRLAVKARLAHCKVPPRCRQATLSEAPRRPLPDVVCRRPKIRVCDANAGLDAAGRPGRWVGHRPQRTGGDDSPVGTTLVAQRSRSGASMTATLREHTALSRPNSSIAGSTNSSEEAVRADRQAATEERVLILEPGRAERNYWRDLWHYRELFAILAWRDVAVRYKQTVIGVAWAVVRPFLTMVVFTIVFGKLAGLPSDGAVPYRCWCSPACCRGSCSPASSARPRAASSATPT